MNRIPLLMSFLLYVVLFSCSGNKDTNKLIDEQMTTAAEQYKAMYHALPSDKLPRTIDKETGELVTSGIHWWTSGFFPGTLWLLHEYTGDQELKKMAIQKTELLEDLQYYTGTHDLGFMIYDSYGEGYRISQNESYKEVMINGAYSLMTRFNETTGCIRSWDHGDWEFPVIVDNMMNLEYLMWAFRATGDSAFYHVSVTHAETTMKNHYRPDYSSYHLVDYDTITGEVLVRQTVQGYADESAWARGQSWGFYGFVTMYRDTKDKKYLDQAIHIADFMMNHPNMPENGVPYWDFNAPNIPDAKRDASAAAIFASGLIELSDYVIAIEAENYLSFAKKIIYTLSSEDYRAKAGENGNFLLKHSVGHLPKDSEVDVPLTYADFYFVEALIRLSQLEEHSE